MAAALRTIRRPFSRSTQPFACHARKVWFTLSLEPPIICPSSRCVSAIWSPCSRRKPLDGACEPHRQVEKDDSLEMVARTPKGPAQHGDEMQGHAGRAVQKGDNVPPVEHQQAAICRRHSVRGSFAAVEQRDLAEHLPRPHHVEQDFLTVGCRRCDLHRALDHNHQKRAVVALAKQRLAFWRNDDMRKLRELLDCGRVRASEQRMLRQQPTRGGGRHTHVVRATHDHLDASRRARRARRRLVNKSGAVLFCAPTPAAPTLARIAPNIPELAQGAVCERRAGMTEPEPLGWRRQADDGNVNGKLGL